MAAPAQASLETTLTRLDDDGRALLFAEARTANTFSDRPVAGEQLEGIYELMRWGPTWPTSLPLRLVYVTTPDGKARLLPHPQPGNVGKATQAPVNAILAVDSAFHHQIPRLFPFRAGTRDTLEADPGLRDKIGAGGAWMQAAYFIIAVRAVGPAARPMGGFDPPASMLILPTQHETPGLFSRISALFGELAIQPNVARHGHEAS